MPLIDVCLGDLTTARADAIVTSADASLTVTGGVNAALHAAAGPGLLAAVRAVGTCTVGEAFSTEAGRLAAARVIHVVPPRFPGDLAAAYRAVLACAQADGCATLALPSLGTGANGFPVDVAAEVAVATVATFVDAWPPPLRLVRFWVADEAALAAYAARIAALGGWLRKARRDDYPFDKLETDPLSATRGLRWERLLGDDEACWLRAGTVAREMEDKWFIYEQSGRVHCHRSWTGFEIFSFRVRARPDGEPGALLDQLQVCNDPERYNGDDTAALEHVGNIVTRLASGLG